MATELLSEFDEDWIDGLAPVQLRYHYEEMIRRRSARQREQLHIQVSAAAVVSDSGKAAKSMDSALSVASSPRNFGPIPAGSEPMISEDAEMVDVSKVNAETASLWREHRGRRNS